LQRKERLQIYLRNEKISFNFEIQFISSAFILSATKEETQ
jgi:hypothetical protein